MVQELSLLSTRPLVSRKTTASTQSEKQGNSKAREEHSRNEAQDHWERLVLTELGDTSKLDSEPAPEFPHSLERCWGRSWDTPQVPSALDFLV